MLAAGAMILAGAWLAHRALHHRAVTIPTGLLGLGVLGVGIFPGNIHPQHPLFAYTAFLAGGLAVLLSSKVTPQLLRVVFAVMGTISLLFTLASGFLLKLGPFARLGLGGGGAVDGVSGAAMAGRLWRLAGRPPVGAGAFGVAAGHGDRGPQWDREPVRSPR
jgi:hypothetical protein